MQEINIEALAGDITDSYYYKRLQQELRKKTLKKKTQTASSETPFVSKITLDKPSHQTKSLLDTPYFQDHVKLSTKEEQQCPETDPQNPSKKQTLQDQYEAFKYNAHDIIRQLSHKINFSERKNEFIEMYKYNLQQSRSHNVFTSRFARFKVGIVGQILTTIGIPIDTLKNFQKTAKNELFEQTNHDIKENIYHTELVEILHGKNKKSKQKSELFITLQHQLITQINNIGRIGFWSKQTLYEEKITQCEKIKEEFETEKTHLEYLLNYLEQRNVS